MFVPLVDDEHSVPVRLMSGVNNVPTSSSYLCLTPLLYTARRHRWSSFGMVCFLLNFSLSTSFSVRSQSMTFCCWRFSQPDRVTRKSYHGCGMYFIIRRKLHLSLDLPVVNTTVGRKFNLRPPVSGVPAVCYAPAEYHDWTHYCTLERTDILMATSDAGLA